MKNKLLYFTLMLVFVCLSCSREGNLQGTVFIVTNGAENYKLGLVKITAIPESKIQQFIENKKATIKTQYDSFKSSQSASKSNINKAQQNFNEAKKDLDSIQAQKDQLLSREQSLNSSFDPYKLEVSPYLAEYETPEERAERFKQQQIQKQIQAVKQQITRIEPTVGTIRQRFQVAEKQLSDLKAQEAQNKQKVLALLNEESLFEGVPDGEIKAVTDADGKFSLKLPNSERFAIIAQSQRRVSSSTEYYYWMVWVSLDKQDTKQIMLTNQNMLGQDSEDSVFKIKDLVPELGKSSDSVES